MMTDSERREVEALYGEVGCNTYESVFYDGLWCVTACTTFGICGTGSALIHSVAAIEAAKEVVRMREAMQ